MGAQVVFSSVIPLKGKSIRGRVLIGQDINRTG